MMTGPKYCVAGIGELLFDIFGDSKRLGGAPANFAFHATALGACGAVVSAVGEDADGKRALSFLAAKGLETKCIATSSWHPTGFVEGFLDDKGVATYHFPRDVAWDHLSLTPQVKELAKEVDAVCFGSLGQRSEISKNAIRSFLALTRKEALKIFDVNLRKPYYTLPLVEESFTLADVVKLNQQEFAELVVTDGKKEREEELLKRFCAKYRLRLAILTKGGEGSLLATATACHHHPGFATTIIDTVGAGDAFTAAVTMGLLKGDGLAAINEQANRLAAFVCSQQGAMVRRE